MSNLSAWEGENGGSQAGFAVLDAGDWDGDGHHDLWISAPQGGSQSQGRVYLASGNALGDLGLSNVIVEGTFPNQNFGHSMTLADTVEMGGQSSTSVHLTGLPEVDVRIFQLSGITGGCCGLLWEGGTTNQYLGAAATHTEASFDSLWSQHLWPLKPATNKGHFL